MRADPVLTVEDALTGLRNEAARQTLEQAWTKIERDEYVDVFGCLYNAHGRRLKRSVGYRIWRVHCVRKTTAVLYLASCRCNRRVYTRLYQDYQLYAIFDRVEEIFQRLGQIAPESCRQVVRADLIHYTTECEHCRSKTAEPYRCARCAALCCEVCMGVAGDVCLECEADGF